MEQIEKRNPVRTWIMASRPRTLTAAIVPVVVGTAVAVRDRVFNPWVALAALFSAVMIQIGTNLANDLFDFKKGADTHTRLGPTRVTSAGLLTPREVEIGMWVVFGLAAASGLYVIYVGGWPMLVIGVASILAGVAYTAGPFPLGYNGLGDLAVFIFFGLVAVLGTYYAQARAVTLGAVLAAVPVGALATAILVVNNVRDADTDRAAGKRTLAVLLGRGAARAEYAVLLTLAYAAPLALWLLRGASVWALLPLLTLPVAVRLARVVITTEGPALNRALAGTAQLLALYGVLFALGIAL
ncbi:MAG: 1,4-dihydroxy-2-naphthoate octaprenyltransferase [Anaerolineales bacterium]|jgi:1,4-dihydroxy-2-naphthoate octaprenyltransferase|nr:1,4-dihydroxy-2-naphthoate octaprenyltransferase [Anaerolineales bacterium]